MKRIIGMMLLFTVLPVGAQVYKCKEGSSTVFSSQPCSAGSEAVTIRPASGPGPRRADFYRRRADELIIGMPSDRAEIVWGKPTHINRTTNSGGVMEQWVYRDGYVSKYLYFTNGKLRSIQD